jgi:lipooligosaccharide transport system permease protein
MSAPLAGLLLPVLGAVWRRELLLFRRYWPAVIFGSLVEPLIYMAGFGIGIGALIGVADGKPYLEFLGTGMVMTSVLFASVFAGMFETFVKRRNQRLYDAILSRPVDVWELVAAEASWIAAKSAVFACVPLAVTVAVGLPVVPELLLVPVIGLVAGFGFALCGIWISCQVPDMDWLRLVISGVLTPLVMAAGVFFPLSGLPGWVTGIAAVNPVYHCMQLVRHSAFADLSSHDFLHACVVLGFTALMWVLAVKGMRRRLIN